MNLLALWKYPLVYTFTGTGFTGATAVSFGGTAASSFTVDSSTRITAVVGYGTAGSVEVTTSGVSGSKTGFTYVPQIPTLSEWGMVVFVLLLLLRVREKITLHSCF